jgi:hypothetical protein
MIAINRSKDAIKENNIKLSPLDQILHTSVQQARI